jgi:hypothetical protein
MLKRHQYNQIQILLIRAEVILQIASDFNPLDDADEALLGCILDAELKCNLNYDDAGDK